ncbi:MAG: coenzyme F420-0:L-glutamate ligase / coenzyme F420:gamma-L-glutamate ligase [Actinomycetota bacterium]|nr:coenzyme F420-0:L-glutamate ligase / coenzyme F420:gamma-L-glutamate ligase [Actinomycetota bacterium]
MSTAPTSSFWAFAVEPFPQVAPGDDLAATIADALSDNGLALIDGDVLVIASKVVSVAENRHVDLDSVTASPQALDISARTGKPAEVVQLILDNSTDHFLATERGPIIAWHTLGYQLTSAGIDRAGERGAWLLPEDPDASARALRDSLGKLTGARIAVVIADSDGRADRRGATVISIGAAGLPAVRISEFEGKRPEETFTDMIAAAAGIILGQRGRGVPAVVLRGIAYDHDDSGVAAMLHRRP